MWWSAWKSRLQRSKIQTGSSWAELMWLVFILLGLVRTVIYVPKYFYTKV